MLSSARYNLFYKLLSVDLQFFKEHHFFHCTYSLLNWQGLQLNARDLQNMGMPVLRRPVNGTAVPVPPPPSLPPGIQGTPESYNPVIR